MAAPLGQPLRHTAARGPAGGLREGGTEAGQSVALQELKVVERQGADDGEVERRQGGQGRAGGEQYDVGPRPE
jgi:hypothetical protein